MKLIIKFTSIIIFALLTLPTFSQSIEFEKDNFPGKKEELRNARKMLDVGIEFYMQGRKEFDDERRGFISEHKFLPVSIRDYNYAGYANFKSALTPLTDANNFNPKNARLNYMLGFIKFFDPLMTKDGLKHFQEAYKLDPECEMDLPFWLGWSYQLTSNWDEAIKMYNVYLTRLNQKPKSFSVDIDDVNKKIAECNMGKTASANPERVFVDNLGPSVNSKYPEYSPSITVDEGTIIFTARRDNSTGSKRDDDGSYYEDIYISNKVNGKWETSKQLSKNVNTEGHDASAGLSPDGSKLFVYRHSGKDGGDLYESTLFGSDWEPPVHMNKNINTKWHESSVSLSYDGHRLYFVSDKANGLGDRDIYYSEIDVKGEWGPAKNLGPDINTKYSEEGVFMHPDGKTMYFSSQGHNSMGGYDIFKSVFENGKWS
ncbi:MAG: PD40 domain-containing protein, partial [Bacteroidia bacterium]|nr:PD40 domain-containing protein [Bacteroidia bacterium]